jgi:Family of unknown function (DUF5372)
VIHPFHPLTGREIEIVTYKKAWGEDRIFFRDEAGLLQHMPVGWTSAGPPDPFKEVAAGRCQFRTEDLLRLVELVEKLREQRSVAGVK